MTPSQWESADIDSLLATYANDLTPRKLRLLACAFVRSIPALCSGSSGEAVALAERFADGAASTHQLASARFGGRFRPGHAAWAVCWGPDQPPRLMVERTLAWIYGFAQHGAHLIGYRLTQLALADRFRDLAGHLVLSEPIDPAWLAREDGVVVRLARTIQEEKAFDRMPILGDALEEVGCTREEILAHCRTGEHVAGCWLLDTLLGKE